MSGRIEERVGVTLWALLGVEGEEEVIEARWQGLEGLLVATLGASLGLEGGEEL
jgi:hypothetical protein